MSVFNIFGEVITAITKKNTQVVHFYGCDGNNHAVFKCREYHDDEGMYFAESLSEKVICKCTGACKNKITKGSFLVE